jgi:hypothetical protein
VKRQSALTREIDEDMKNILGKINILQQQWKIRQEFNFILFRPDPFTFLFLYMLPIFFSFQNTMWNQILFASLIGRFTRTYFNCHVEILNPHNVMGPLKAGAKIICVLFFLRKENK